MSFSLIPKCNIYLCCISALLGKMTPLFNGQRVCKYINALILQVGILIGLFFFPPPMFLSDSHGFCQQWASWNPYGWSNFSETAALTTPCWVLLKLFSQVMLRINKLFLFTYFILPLSICKHPCTITRSKFIFFSLNLNQLQLPNKNRTKENNSTGFDTTK